VWICVYCIAVVHWGSRRHCIERLLHSVIDNIVRRPSFDFESAVINAVKTALGAHVLVKGYFLTCAKAPSVRSKITNWFVQSLTEALSTYLPESDVPASRSCLRRHWSTSCLVDILIRDTAYVLGAVRRIQRPATDNAAIPRPVLRRLPPLFPPSLLNVHDALATRTTCVKRGTAASVQ